MKDHDYSPYDPYNAQNTVHRQTTSYKKYPINKYYASKNPSEVKNQLFTDKFQNDKLVGKLNFNHNQNQINYLQKQQAGMFYANDRVKNILKENHMNALNSVSFYENKSKNYAHNLSEYPIYPYKDQQKSLIFNQKSKKITTKKRAQSTKSYSSTQLKRNKKQLYVKQKVYDQQKQQQLQMYKKLCITLRKQNENLSDKIQKQNKKTEKFSSQIGQLKGKIRKMYDYCIQKNKSRKNVDAKFNMLFENYNLIDKTNNNTKKQGIMSTYGDNKNSKICKKRSHQSQSLTVRNTINNTRTIDSQINTKRQNSSNQLMNYSKFMKKQPTKNKQAQQQKIVKSSQRYCYNHIKPSCPSTINLKSTNNNYYQQDNINYSQNQQQSIFKNTNLNNQTILTKQNQVQNNLQQNTLQYKQFFLTFIKSLQIFQDSSINNHNQKLYKAKLLKQNGFNIQWAKQQWLDIVEFLIKKNYVSSQSSNTRVKRNGKDKQIIKNNNISKREFSAGNTSQSFRKETIKLKSVR